MDFRVFQQSNTELSHILSSRILLWYNPLSYKSNRLYRESVKRTLSSRGGARNFPTGG